MKRNYEYSLKVKIKIILKRLAELFSLFCLVVNIENFSL
jgi:hypothetical protein